MFDMLASELATDPASVIKGQNKPMNVVHDGRFFIHGLVDETIATEILPALTSEIEKKRKEKDASIQVYIDTNGGQACYTKSILTLFERAKSYDIDIETYVFARAYSAGSLIACAGTKRFVGPYAEHLCHLGSTTTKRMINDTELEREKQRAQNHDATVREIYTRYARIKNLEEVIRDDSLFIRGQDLIDNGLADTRL